MSGRVIAAGTLVLLAAMLIAPAVWPSAPWASAVRAASCAGASHDILLTAPNASPRTGTRTTLIAFTVTYRDTAGCPPTGVFVVVLGAGQATMTATRSAWATGVTFRAAMRLPIGSWAYRFDASSGSGGGVRNATVAGPGTIVISAPSPTPTPTPKPTATPRPTPTQTPRATASPTSSPTPTAAASATAGAGSPSPSAESSIRPGASPSTDAASGSGRPVQSPGARPSDATRAAGSIDEPGGPGGGDAAGGGHADGFRLPGFAVDHEVGLSLATWLIAVTVGVVLFAATYQGRGLVVELPGELSVLVLKRRRGAPRDTAQPDSAAEPAAAPDAAVDDAPGSTADGAPRDHVQVRIESPLDDGDTGRGPRRFDAPPAPRVERRAIAYQSVRLSGGPDDLRSAEIARLRRRDEVEIIGEEGSAVRVRTPEGLEGWVPRIVLVGLPAASIAPPAAPAEGMTRPSRRGWRRPPHGPAGSPRSA